MVEAMVVMVMVVEVSGTTGVDGRCIYLAFGGIGLEFLLFIYLRDREREREREGSYCYICLFLPTILFYTYRYQESRMSWAYA